MYIVLCNNAFECLYKKTDLQIIGGLFGFEQSE